MYTRGRRHPTVGAKDGTLPGPLSPGPWSRRVVVELHGLWKRKGYVPRLQALPPSALGTATLGSSPFQSISMSCRCGNPCLSCFRGPITVGKSTTAKLSVAHLTGWKSSVTLTHSSISPAILLSSIRLA